MYGEEPVIYGLEASLLATAMNGTAIVLAAFFTRQMEAKSSCIAAFAIGLLAAALLFHLLPELLHTSLLTAAGVVAGFAILTAIELSIGYLSRSRKAQAAHTFGYIAVITGLAVHSFVDGTIYAASFRNEPFTGWMATSALIFHEVPEGIIAFGLLSGTGTGRLNAGIIAFCAAGLSTLAGTLTANLVLGPAEIPLVSLPHGVITGALIYILVAHLAPRAFRKTDRRIYMVAISGAAIGAGTVVIQHVTGAGLHDIHMH